MNISKIYEDFQNIGRIFIKLNLNLEKFANFQNIERIFIKLILLLEKFENLQNTGIKL